MHPMGNGEKYIEEYFKLFRYLNEFSNEGIEFKVFNKRNNTEGEEVLFSLSYDGKVRYKIDLVNKEYQGELIDRFYRRKWQDYNVRWSADMFAKRELKHLNEFPSFLTRDYEDLFNDLRYYLDCRRFLTEEDISLSEPIPPAAAQSMLKNYKDFVTTFSVIESYLKKKGYVLTKETISWINQPHVSGKLFESVNEAYSEIEDLMISNNNGRSSLISKLNNDIRLICGILDNLVKNNPIITKTESAIGNDRKTIIDNLCGIDSDIFMCYTDLIGYYNLCYDSIAKLGDVSTPDSEPSTVLGSKDVDRFKKDSSTIPQNDKITILFDSPETLDKLFGAMKPLFPKEREEDFSNLLKGKPLIEKLDFPLNQNQLSDIFRRLYETNRILNSKVQITNWLYQNFTNKGECLGSSIYDNLTKAKYQTSKSKRLYTDIFPPK